MNERIRELAERAENYAHEQNDKFGLSYKREYDKKFAELIIRECMGVVDDAVNFREPASTYVGKIKQHFGIKE